MTASALTKAMSEAELQRGIIEGAEWAGWMCYHVTRVDTTLLSYNTTAPGFQDCNLVHGERALFVYAELKNHDRDRIPNENQARWALAVVMAARLCPDRVFAVRWRPQHYDEALRFLRGETDTPPGIITPLEAKRWQAANEARNTKRSKRASRGARRSSGRTT